MELQREQAALAFWELAADFTAGQEETAEVIVPDSCPDIARVLSAAGNVFLQQSEVREGKATLSGVIRISVLYIPEKSQTVQAACFTLPFQMAESCPADCTALCAEVSAEELAAHTLNPRKLRLRCRLSADICAYRFVTLSYTSGIGAEPSCAVEQLPRQETVELITALSEQEFTCEERFHLPQNRGGASAVLCTQLRCTVEDAKIIGTKAVVKGRYLTDILLRYDSGSCESSTFELPFSHISEIESPQTAHLSAHATLTALTVEPERSEDGDGALRLSVTSRLRLSVMQTQELRVVEDLYSTAYPVSCEMQELRLLDAAQPQLRRQVWQDTLELGVSVERVLRLSASCGTVTAAQDASGVPELRTTLRLYALCLAEDGRVLSAERSADVTLACPDAAGSVRCRAFCGEEMSSVATADGLLVRIPVDFCLRPRQFRTIRCVAAASLDETAPGELARQPSLVLRRKLAEESLWSLAKRHSSTVGDILAANECAAESELPADAMLLIPRRRA